MKPRCGLLDPANSIRPINPQLQLLEVCHGPNRR
jgi:hypothetical protein